jgi:hypothetical protein
VFTTLAVTQPSKSQLDLNCLVLGDDISAGHVFSVKIAKSETVGGLKDTIKDKKTPEFDDHAADCLDLWKVND